MSDNDLIIETNTPKYPIKMYDVNYVAVVDIDTGNKSDDISTSFNDIFEVSSKNKYIKRVRGRVGFVECVFEDNSFIVRPITKDHIVFGVSKTDFTETLNEYKASMFYMIGCDGFTYSNTISDEFKHCITYVGGFVDSFYFIKSEIMKLSDLDFQRFINRLDYCRSKFSQSTTNSETEK